MQRLYEQKTVKKICVFHSQSTSQPKTLLGTITRNRRSRNELDRLNSLFFFFHQEIFFFQINEKFKQGAGCRDFKEFLDKKTRKADHFQDIKKMGNFSISIVVSCRPDIWVSDHI